MDSRCRCPLHPFRMGTLLDGLLIKSLPSQYTSSQASQYLARISFPPELDAFKPSLKNLERLLRLHLLNFPLENTAMHYTPHHQMDVTPQGVFQRMVLDRKGSYCYGHGVLFLEVIRALGYRAYAIGARVNENFADLSKPRFGPITHIALLVQPFPSTTSSGYETYLVDAWYGSTTLIRPILLSDAEGTIVMGATSNQRHRLTRRPLPTSSRENPDPLANNTISDLMWCLEVQHSKGDDDKATAPWKILYAFTEDESYPADIENNSFAASNSPTSSMMNGFLCVQFLSFLQLDEEGKAQAAAEFGELSGGITKDFLWRYVLFNDKVQRGVGANTVTIRTLNNELERIGAIREFFHIDIPDDAGVYVEGRKVALGI